MFHTPWRAAQAKSNIPNSYVRPKTMNEQCWVTPHAVISRRFCFQQSLTSPEHRQLHHRPSYRSNALRARNISAVSLLTPTQRLTEPKRFHRGFVQTTRIILNVTTVSGRTRTASERVCSQSTNQETRWKQGISGQIDNCRLFERFLDMLSCPSNIRVRFLPSL